MLARVMVRRMMAARVALVVVAARLAFRAPLMRATAPMRLNLDCGCSHWLRWCVHRHRRMLFPVAMLVETTATPMLRPAVVVRLRVGPMLQQTMARLHVAAAAA